MVEEGAGVCYKCSLPAKLLCPTCVEMKKGKVYFCEARCLRLAWKAHNAEHRYEPESKSSEAQLPSLPCADRD